MRPLPLLVYAAVLIYCLSLRYSPLIAVSYMQDWVFIKVSKCLIEIISAISGQWIEFGST